MADQTSPRAGGRRAMRPFVVLAFASARASLAAEGVLKRAGLAVRVMPLPRQRGGRCGVALRLPPTEAAAAAEILRTQGIEIAGRDEIMDY